MIKKIVLCFLSVFTMFSLTACGNPFQETSPQATANPYAIKVLTKDNLENDHYYIKHGEDFYEIPEGEASFGTNAEDDNLKNYILAEGRDEGVNGDPFRSFFYTKNKSELLIPTMYQDDELVYKTSLQIDDWFEWERFIDDGYTIGLRRISVNDLNKLVFTNYWTNILKDSPFNKSLNRIEDDDDEEYRAYSLNIIDNKILTEKDISPAGSIMGLDTTKELTVDCYEGTKLIRIKSYADTRIFYNFENYWTKGMSFCEDGYVSIRIPVFFKDGYYKTNQSGMFRYINQEYSDTIDISKRNYNQAFFAMDKDGNAIVKQDEDNHYIYK